MSEQDVMAICARLYYGWDEKTELPEMAKNPSVYRMVQDRLAQLGMELVDRVECRWYVVRPLRQYDGMAQFARRNRTLQSRHLALLLILYAKLLLPRRVGQVDPITELMVTFHELYESYGGKFKPSNRKTATEQGMKTLLSTLARLGFVHKRRGVETYEAGPAMYMLHDDLLANVGETALQVILGYGELEVAEYALAEVAGGIMPGEDEEPEEVE